MKKIVLYLTLLLLLSPSLKGQEKDTLDFIPDYTTYEFGERDTCFLYMDVYQPKDTLSKHPCLIMVFGGGFITGKRDSNDIIRYCTNLSQKGYVAIAIDYRLGLKGVTKVNATHSEPLKKALYMAVEDLYSSVSFILDNHNALRIDPEKVVTCGSSAGAITVLQADYMLSNRFSIAEHIPEDFHFAGVISYSGAIFSQNGRLKYKNHNPAPTMLLHGTSDRLVPYNKIRLFKLGFFGSNSIAKTFFKNNYNFHIARYDDLGHEVASFFNSTINEADLFIKEYVIKGRDFQTDETIKLMNYTGPSYSRWTPDDLYKDKK